MIIGDKNFNIPNKIYIMGIVNITPDSFFDGGKLSSKQSYLNDDDNEYAILKRVEKLIREGADIIDIGAESTRPGYVPISVEEELKRLGNIVTEIKKRFNIAISVDTTKADVAKVVLQQGADLINDISCCADKNMANVVAKFNASYCLTYNKKMQGVYDFWNELVLELKCKLQYLVNNGVDKNKIVIDPGIGFNKTFEENIIIMKNLSNLLSLGYPILIGASNKSFIGKILKQDDVSKRLNGTIAISVLAAVSGAQFIRVHDVLANAEAIKIVEACGIYM